MKSYLCFSDNYPNGIILKQDQLKILIGYKTIIEIDSSLTDNINSIL